ncbi:glutaredoxin-like protein NrdH [Lactococcus carnosus]|uniref:Glutaredoxin-like protein NrdH n=1 Tax=Pseudolactococcus carnosus TaxID=2749961 RepID=A0ABT0AQH2_9LACT|nr:glutaredoxin-like protein NrdH [Lactococcus carnosus]MCJ1981198.1 glutaredoxin-like protein NrdH [Lactococcus carnosus]MCJ1988959.1 glutaredoxin-like protein NrdH [Lactococcus carnosus]
MVTVFSKNNCMQCNMVKKWLVDKAVQFKEINIDDEPQYIDHVKEMGFMAAPIIVKDNVSFSGFRPAELAKLI